MADLVFDLRKGELKWETKGLKWKAVSGINGKRALPTGTYVIGRREITENTNKIGASFQNKDGIGFFVPIYPQFETTRGKSGGRLGIHPDGYVPGTLGCIGLDPAGNTSSFYNAIKQSPVSKQLLLQVN